MFFIFRLKNYVALTRVRVSQPRDKSTKILRCVFLEHLNLTIFLFIGRAIFFRLALFQRNSVVLTRGWILRPRGWCTKIVRYVSREHKIIRFFCTWAGRSIQIYPSLKNAFTPTRGCVYRPLSWSTKIMRRAFSEHLNCTISVCMGRAIFLNLCFHLRKILLLRRDDGFSGRGLGALKSCDAYSRSTKLVRLFCAWAGWFFKIHPSSSKNSFTPMRGCVFRPQGWSTKTLRCIFPEQVNRKIFLCIMRQIWKYLHF